MTNDLERRLMPNAYVKHLGQEIPDLRGLTADSGIAPKELAHLPHPVTVAQSICMLRNARGLAESADWHLRWGQRMGENLHGIVSMAWLSAPTFGSGFDTFLKYIPSRVPYHHWQGYRCGNEFVAEIVELMDFGAVRTICVEVPLLVMYAYARMLQPGAISNARIELRYSAPSYRASYVQWFECPILFGARRNALVLPLDWRDIHNPGFDPATWNFASSRCRELCSEAEARDLLSKVRRILIEALDQPHANVVLPSLESMANRMHCSSRTLIRRLRATNTVYHQLVEQMKMERAQELLGNSELRIHQIAARLGYQDTTAFIRLFKRCAGLTPGEYRTGVRDEA